jgi:hypothetical protein
MLVQALAYRDDRLANVRLGLAVFAGDEICLPFGGPRGGLALVLFFDAVRFFGDEVHLFTRLFTLANAWEPINGFVEMKGQGVPPEEKNGIV